MRGTRRRSGLTLSAPKLAVQCEAEDSHHGCENGPARVSDGLGPSRAEIRFRAVGERVSSMPVGFKRSTS